MAKKKQYNWDAIEKEYIMGQKSLRTLSSEFGPCPAAISKRSKKYDWNQGKAALVIRKTEEALLTGDVNSGQSVNEPTPEDIDRAVKTNVQVIREHRKDITTNRNIVSLLAGQLKDAAENREELEEQIVNETDGEKVNYNKRNKMIKAVSLPSHAAVIRDLSTAMKNLIALERQAFNIDGKRGEDTVLVGKLPPEIAEMIKYES